MNLTTERLNIRHLESSDASFIVELLNSKGFIENIGDRGVKTIAQAEQMIKNKFVLDYPSHGLFAVERRSDKKLIGSVSFIKRDCLIFDDIGYAFLPEYFGQGYAIEAVESLVGYAREHGYVALNAVVDSPNIVSQRLLAKLKFTYDGTIIMPDEDEPINRYQLIL